MEIFASSMKTRPCPVWKLKIVNYQHCIVQMNFVMTLSEFRQLRRIHYYHEWHSLVTLLRGTNYIGDGVTQWKQCNVKSYSQPFEKCF